MSNVVVRSPPSRRNDATARTRAGAPRGSGGCAGGKVPARRSSVRGSSARADQAWRAHGHRRSPGWRRAASTSSRRNRYFPPILKHGNSPRFAARRRVRGPTPSSSARSASAIHCGVCLCRVRSCMSMTPVLRCRRCRAGSPSAPQRGAVSFFQFSRWGRIPQLATLAATCGHLRRLQRNKRNGGGVKTPRNPHATDRHRPPQTATERQSNVTDRTHRWGGPGRHRRPMPWRQRSPSARIRASPSHSSRWRPVRSQRCPAG